MNRQQYNSKLDKLKAVGLITHTKDKSNQSKKARGGSSSAVNKSSKE